MKTCDDCMWRIALEDEVKSLQQQITQMRAHLEETLSENRMLQRRNDRLAQIAEEVRKTNVQLRQQLSSSASHKFVGIHTSDSFVVPGLPHGRKITVK